MSFKSLRILAAVATSMALLAGMPASAAEKVSLRLKWLAQAQFAGFYVAKAKGFYDQGGLDLTINPGGPNLNVETLVASGNDTFGLAGGTETVLLAREKGLPLVCIGVTVQNTPFTYVTYKDSGITKVKDFAGKKVATWFTGTQYTLYSMLASAGVKQSDLTIVPQSGSMAPFVEKQFDVAAATYYNELNTLKEQGLGDKLTLIKPDDYGVVVQQDTVLVSEKYRNEKPQQVQAFLTATIKGWKYALQNKKEAIDIVMAAAPSLNRAHQEAMLDEFEKLVKAGKGTTDGILAIDLPTVEKMQAQLVGYKALKAPADLSKAYDASFWTQVPAADKKF
ncbi:MULTISPECIES: ABC transporter substrate-binding protein [Variovorax]|jgi:NitT/TauT family transport system substrate-binding protein|uniref:ABC transporter substrate-binding protein n=1 Tax=Variovorax TaxID=34072 RepID=UPI00089C69E6|nr:MULTISPECIES: ABC transporter substrate-binding protein [Variovorax]MDQ0081265.1 NitT/TauT family transport system substrate-binding protein [Variovorax boronicumulans]UVH54831.1 ABC transporter substrate-binding protein [Variovorax paradoxus]SDW99744.1 NitT/TauT family transport system substrate-binding protein [Variovorax sp. YR634]SDZ47243.1 NitT/TauT family transport system substrate-binding protein [Variovorax sp. YR266]SET84329.1 NitT/TauT family transport system substrate-binding pro